MHRHKKKHAARPAREKRVCRFCPEHPTFASIRKRVVHERKAHADQIPREERLKLATVAESKGNSDSEILRAISELSTTVVRGPTLQELADRLQVALSSRSLQRRISRLRKLGLIAKATAQETQIKGLQITRDGIRVAFELHNNAKG
jgi:hypothetical protein